jgi:hypothetical protein
MKMLQLLVEAINLNLLVFFSIADAVLTQTANKENYAQNLLLIFSSQKVLFGIKEA